MEWVTEYIEEFQYAAIALVLFLAGLGVPIPEDIPLIYGGVMAGQGKMDVSIHFAVSMIFIIIGDTCLYLIGRRVSRSSKVQSGQDGDLPSETPTRFERLLSPERREKVQSYFDRYGSWAVFLGRFVAGVRGAVFLTAGLTNFPIRRFIILDGLAALLSVPIWIGIGYWVGERWTEILDTAKSYQLYVLFGLAISAVIYWVVRRRREDKESEID